MSQNLVGVNLRFVGGQEYPLRTRAPFRPNLGDLLARLGGRLQDSLLAPKLVAGLDRHVLEGMRLGQMPRCAGWRCT